MTISTILDPAAAGQLDTVVSTLLAPASGISVVAGSVSLQTSGPGAVNLYDAATGAGLGIGAGVLLTSGTTPGSSNTLTWYGSDNSGTSGFSNGDADIDAVVNTVFQTQSYDATVLKFDFTVSTPAATSVSFDLVFGSEEYPEWVDAFVDCAVVIVDGVNYALFNKNPNAPLSVISPNLAAGYFQDNAAGTIPIEYDGVSGRLRIVAPLDLSRSVHTIKIGIADTGDHILDSGLFISGLAAGTDPGSGVVSDPGGGTTGDDNCSGSSKDEYFNLLAGNDTVYAAGGADIVVAGSGNDKVYGGSGNDELKGDQGDDLLDGGADCDTAVYAGASSAYTITYDAATDHYSINGTSQGEGLDTLVGIEQLKFSDGLFSLTPSGLAAVTPPPPPPTNSAGALVISGLAAVGYTLSGHLSDADGLPADPAAVSWQWFADGVAISGATSATHVVQSSELNASLWLEASYTDAKGNSEQLSSNGVSVLPPSDGDLTVTLMAIDGPANAGVHTAITTLLLRAVELGESPNSAVQKIRSALKLPAAAGNLLTFNAFSILQSGQGDAATALSLAKLEVEVAILCSLSDDQQGIKLTLALLDKASSGGSFDLSQAADLAAILGLDPGSFNLSDKTTYPQPLKEIVDRTSNISQASTLFSTGTGTGTGSSIESEWKDFLTNWDSLADTVPLSTLSQAINQAPTGVADAALPSVMAGEAYSLSAAQLLSGFHDPDKDPLQVSGLTSDHGAWFTDNGDGTWSLDPTAPDYDPTYRGPLELSYWIDDGQGHSIAATQLLLVVDHANHLPSGQVNVAVVGGGTVAQNATLQASDSLVDPDGLSGPISYGWYADTTLLGSGSTLKLGQSHVGLKLHVEASYTDDFGTLEVVSSAETAAVANVDDAPTGSVTLNAGNPPKVGDTLTAANDVSDLDGIPSSGANALKVQWQSSADGLSWSDIAGATGSSLVLAAAQVGQKLRAQVRYTDLFGTANAISSAATSAVAGAGIVWSGTSAADTKSGTAWDDSLSGAAGNDKLSGLAGNDWLDGGSGIDTLIGGLGNDTYGVDNASDLITELSGEGLDTALASVTYSLLSKGGNVEALVLTGTAALNGTGNALANTLTGNSAANVLDGGAGNDTLIGGAGNDTYIVDSAADVVVEAAGGGIDLVKSGISFSLAAFGEVEHLTLTGSAALNGTGNAGANTLTGNSGANVLQGSGGNDTLIGNGGNDTLAGGKGADQLSGGLGADVFRFDTAPEKLNGSAVVDTITDFSLSQADRVELSSQAFTALTGSAVSGGLLAAGAFLASASGTATTSAQRILYNSSTGALSYDSDGSGATAAQAFAKLAAGLALTSSQFLVSNLPLGL